MDDVEQWRPRCPPPRGWVRPVGLDPSGETGPTRGQAAGPRWRRVGQGLYVPSGAAPTVEQRILEVAATLPEGAMLTGWAALRLWGGAFFDGRDGRGAPLPVPVLAAHDHRLRNVPGRQVVRTRHLPAPVVRHGVSCVPAEVAVLDAIGLAPDPRWGVVALDMAAAAEITSIRRVAEVLDRSMRRRGVGRLRWVLKHAHEESRSPRETLFRLIWVIDAGLPVPLVNRPVHDRSGRLVGVPDLLDPGAGITGEYDGAAHRARARHRSDVARRERFARVGLETAVMVAGDSVGTVVARIHAAGRRARWLPAVERPWACDIIDDPCEPPRLSLDERLDLRDLQAERWAREG